MAVTRYFKSNSEAVHWATLHICPSLTFPSFFSVTMATLRASMGQTLQQGIISWAWREDSGKFLAATVHGRWIHSRFKITEGFSHVSLQTVRKYTKVGWLLNIT